MTKRLSTKRLDLSPFSAIDLPVWLKLMRNENVRAYLGGPVPLRRCPAKFFADLTASQRFDIWTARSKDSNQLIGFIKLTRHADLSGRELSFMTLPQFWGRGLTKEGCERILNHARIDLHLDVIYAETQSANLASNHLLQSLGMDEFERRKRFGAEQTIYATNFSAPT